MTDRLRDVLARITADLKRVHREGLPSLKSRDDQATQVPTNFQANVQVFYLICMPEAQAVDMFKAAMTHGCCHALLLQQPVFQNLTVCWRNCHWYSRNLVTLMLNYHTHAWNKTIQGKQAVQPGNLL